MTAITHPGASPHPAPTSDHDRLVQLVAALERSQLTEDPEAFLALFDPEAVWVTGGGRRLVGIDEIAAFTRMVLPGAMADLSVRYIVRGVRFLTPDIAVTSVDQEYLSADGARLSPRQRGMPTYTWRRRGGEWLIVNGQNTGVVEEAGPLLLSEADEASLREVISTVELGFNQNDADLLLLDVAADAHVVNARGAVLRGREAIDEATREGLADAYLRDATAHYRVSDIELVAPGVAVLHKDAWSDAAAADAGEPPEMNALYVLVKRDGRWWILRRQNTLVPSSGSV
ncbi:uncharacterized protein (TIGR02246 family) [Marmoricola sp. OAE513]|uniref:SgcJ/EcaC family oxidoreductase n=1 Tax=Marmoricola sp. OAE513 TaxID=2817894 RepID=UPI001AE2C3C7